MWIRSCPYWAQHIEILNVGGSKMRALGTEISISSCGERGIYYDSLCFRNSPEWASPPPSIWHPHPSGTATFIPCLLQLP